MKNANVNVNQPAQVKRHSESGFSLLEVLMAVGILSIVSLTMVNVFTAQNKQTRRLSQKIGSSDFKNTFLAVMQDVSTCAVTLDAGANPALVFDSTQPSPSIRVPVVHNGTSGTAPIIAQDNMEITSGVAIERIDLMNLTPSGPNKYSGTWRITLKTLDQGAMSLAPINLNPQTFTVDLTNPTAAKITGCTAVSGSSGGGAAGWSLTGNDIAADPTSFIGTTTDFDILIKRNNTRVGMIGDVNIGLGLNALGSNKVGNNYAFGNNALLANTTGKDNIAVGLDALRDNLASKNMAIGNQALLNNTSGLLNLAIGDQALRANTTGLGNTAVGASTLFLNTFGSQQTAVGQGALTNSSNGNGNTAVGYQAALSLITGNYNVAIGQQALYHGQLGTETVAIGYRAHYTEPQPLRSTAIGFESQFGSGTGGSSDNTSVGFRSLRNISIGKHNVAIGGDALRESTVGIRNTAVGYGAMVVSTTAKESTAFGYSALLSNTSGSSNTAIGYTTLNTNSTGNDNTALGYGALRTNNTGNKNTALGWAADVSTGSLTNATAIGANTTVDASNKVRIGYYNVNVIEGAVPFTTSSDRALKDDIQPYGHGLDLILKLRPVSYVLKADSTRKKHSGFVAQEVEEIGVPFYGITKPASKKGFYALAYSEFVVPLVNAVKEIWQMVTDLATKTEQQEARIRALESTLHAQEQQILQMQQWMKQMEDQKKLAR